jgi:type IV pilus assembly protein PilV
MMSRQSQLGLTLIEVLVAILVMAIGLVGMAALQASTLKYQQGTVQRAKLAGLVSDFAERVRSNPTQAPGMVVSSPYLLSQTWETASGKTSFPVTGCADADACTPADYAARDLAEWQQKVRDALPRGSAAVLASGNQGLNVVLMWSDKDNVAVANGAATANASLTCTDDSTGAGSLSCCPDAVAAPDGVRCANFVLIP